MLGRYGVRLNGQVYKESLKDRYNNIELVPQRLVNMAVSKNSYDDILFRFKR